MAMSTILCNHEPATEWPAPRRCQSHQSAGEWSMRVTRISSPALQAAFFAHDHSRVRVRTPSPHSNGPGSTAVMTQSSRRSMGVSPFEFGPQGAILPASKTPKYYWPLSRHAHVCFTFQFRSYPLHIRIPDHMQHAFSHVRTFHVELCSILSYSLLSPSHARSSHVAVTWCITGACVRACVRCAAGEFAQGTLTTRDGFPRARGHPFSCVRFLGQLLARFLHSQCGCVTPNAIQLTMFLSVDTMIS
ncbi:hypothetical protein F5148DRAFT_728588 [Russula earlei]|uniref:Uncharacterized protein n=1 Tax=Russula earlei TaxID=71964 RepID=A0ACC0UNN6_9AGAM|nr:hypothetical protein F5148DRAFT_728588 [Russula earlei]